MSILLDDKVMLAEPLRFPKVSSGLSGLLSRSGTNAPMDGGDGIPFSVRYAPNFDGQAGALYLFRDSVSDATFLSLSETTAADTSSAKTALAARSANANEGGNNSCGARPSTPRRRSSAGPTWTGGPPRLSRSTPRVLARRARAPASAAAGIAPLLFFFNE